LCLDVPMLHLGLSAVQTATSGTAVGSAPCEVCGAPLKGRQTVACSEKCRARRWRNRRDQARQHRDAELRVLALAVSRSAAALLRQLADPT
jgi:hypothetical protein